MGVVKRDIFLTFRQECLGVIDIVGSSVHYKVTSDMQWRMRPKTEKYIETPTRDTIEAAVEEDLWK